MYVCVVVVVSYEEWLLYETCNVCDSSPFSNSTDSSCYFPLLFYFILFLSISLLHVKLLYYILKKILPSDLYIYITARSHSERKQFCSYLRIVT